MGPDSVLAPLFSSVSQGSCRFNIRNKPGSFISPKDFGGDQIKNETVAQKYSKDKPFSQLSR